MALNQCRYSEHNLAVDRYEKFSSLLVSFTLEQEVDQSSCQGQTKDPANLSDRTGEGSIRLLSGWLAGVLLAYRNSGYPTRGKRQPTDT
jgi:hypothetical protein